MKKIFRDCVEFSGKRCLKTEEKHMTGNVEEGGIEENVESEVREYCQGNFSLSSHQIVLNSRVGCWVC